MNVRQGMFRLWIVVSGVWLLGDGFVWYLDSSTERTRIAAVDECGKILPPLPLSYAPWESDPTVAQYNEATLHHCVPNVGSVSLKDFIVMPASARGDMRQGSEDAIRALSITAITYGLSVPAGLLVIGLVLGWVVRGFRSG